MTENSENTRKDSLRMALLTVLLAIPGLTVIIIRFISDTLGDTSGLKFAILIIGEIGADMLFVLAIMSFYYLYKFTCANPSFKNYSTKSNLKFSIFFIIFGAVCYIIKLMFFIFKTGEIDFATIYYFGFFSCGLPIVIYPIVLSDENLYIGYRWQTYSIEKIKLDNIDEIERSINKHEDYLDLQFHYDEKEVKALIKRTEMTELREIMSGSKQNER
jgi:hypothetical protein